MNSYVRLMLASPGVWQCYTDPRYRARVEVTPDGTLHQLTSDLIREGVLPPERFSPFTRCVKDPQATEALKIFWEQVNKGASK